MVDVIKSMNYKQFTKNNKIFGKPVGYSLFVISLITNRIYQIFETPDKNLLTWDSQPLSTENKEELINQIKLFETYNYHKITTPSNFEFSTMEEKLEKFL